jgi:hypothetical protein
MRPSAVLILPAFWAGFASAQVSATPLPPSVPQAAFVGFVTDSAFHKPVYSVDVRLYFIDSSGTNRAAPGVPDVFIDTLRSRIAVSDSIGYFTFWHLATGRYLMQARRIGFNPIEAVVTVDSETILHDFGVEPLVPMLAKVEVHAISHAEARLEARLDRVGFTSRYKFRDCSCVFVRRVDIERRQPQTLREILQTYGVHQEAEFQIDKMPVDYQDIEDYPADLIAGVEIYRHNRPIEYDATRRGPTLLSAGGQANLMRPLVIIWTWIP